MSKITTGEVSIILGDDDKTLVPTLGAATRISRAFGGFQAAHQKLLASDLDAFVTVIQHGLGLKTEAETKGLREKVWSAGISSLMLPLVEFVSILANGGRPIEEATTEDEGKSKGNDPDDE